MKKLMFLLFIFFISCKSPFMVSEPIFKNSNSCPENGNCTIELIPNKSISFKKDKFGIAYPEIIEGGKTILKYTYKKNPANNTEDSNYTELIYAEFDKEITEIELINEQLQNIKLYFGRLCYCKGETGYFPIKNGKLKLTKPSKNTVEINFDFKIKEVPQIVSKINETFLLKSTQSN